MVPDPLLISVGGLSDGPLHQQVYSQVRDMVLTGRLSPGQRLPSSRALAGEIGISRTAVLMAYDRLTGEGYLEALQGSGTRVCLDLPQASGSARKGDSGVRTTPGTGGARPLSARGRQVSKLAIPHFADEGLPFDFRRGSADLGAFPIEPWVRCLARTARSITLGQMDYLDDPFGHAPLRAAIATHIAQARGVRCEPGQVMIVAGVQQALALALDVLADPGASVAMEDPGYPGTLLAFRHRGLRITPLPVREGGLDLDALKAGPASRLVYVTPSHQYPTGVVMNLTKRLELLETCRKRGICIFEDDYDSEFRYGSPPMPCLQGLDADDRVLYAGTFSKTLFPALRMGYLVVPRALAEPLARARWATDRQPPVLDQLALHAFIDSGQYGRHVRRMRSLYARKRDVLLEALEKHLPGRVLVHGDRAGLHLRVTLSAGLDEREVLTRAAEAGVGLERIADYRIRSRGPWGFLLRFGALSEARIREGIRRLAAVLPEQKRGALR